MTDINLEDCVGRTFERDGERFTIRHVFELCVLIEDEDSTYDVPPSFMMLWLAGAVEVENKP